MPSARYLAMRVETEYTDGATDHSQVRWYAAGVGLVKEMRRSPGCKTETVLKAFVPAKD